MQLSALKTGLLAFFISSALHAAPDISNLNSCIKEIRRAETSAPTVPTFDPYVSNYSKLLADLNAASKKLPHVYQEAAAKPFIQFLEDLGPSQYRKIFHGTASDENTAVLQQIIPDVALAILFHEGPSFIQGVNAFQEIASDLYDGFVADEARVSQQTGVPIDPPTYGIIPPLVKFGNADAGPYTWPCDATNQIFGMGCAVVSLPPAQLKGGLLAWSSLGHETGGHDVTHADEGLLDELATKVYSAVYSQFHSADLAKYWANCIDETSADVCGYLNMGPSLGIGLIGYFRALGNGTLRTVGSNDDPHPIDLLRGYLAAEVAKRLTFAGAAEWSQIITDETNKDRKPLYFVDQYGSYQKFPVPFATAVASTSVVAETIMKSQLDSLQGHSLQEIQDWKDSDQAIVDNLVTVFKTAGNLPPELAGPGFNATYVVASATQTALTRNANITGIFRRMQTFLAKMHQDNPTWSVAPTAASRAYLDQRFGRGQQEVQRVKQLFVKPNLKSLRAGSIN